MTPLSTEAQALIRAVRAGGDPSAAAVARMRDAIVARVAAGDVFDSGRVPPPNRAAAIARGALGRWIGCALIAGSLGAHAPVAPAHSRSARSNVTSPSHAIASTPSERMPPANVLASNAPDERIRLATDLRAHEARSAAPAAIRPRLHREPARAARTIIADNVTRAAQSRPRPSAPPAPAYDPTTTPMSEAMATALRLYAQERWSESAVQFERVVEGEMNDAPATVQRAQFHLARALEHLGLHQAALDVFDEIVQRGAEHAYFGATLPWLAALSRELPESAGIARRVGAYEQSYLAAFDHDDTRDLHDELLYLMARARYDEGRLDESIALFRRIAPGSRFYARARVIQGVASVRAHRSQPAADAFREVIGAVEHGTPGIDDRERMADLAWLQLARLYYATGHHASAIEAWDHIHVQSEYWLDAEFEEAWAYLLTGDDQRALGNIHTLQSPYFDRTYYPESLVLRGVIQFSNCQYEDAEMAVAQFHSRYDALVPALERYLASHDGSDSAGDLVRDARDAASRLPAALVPLATAAIGDRSVRGDLEYLDRIDAEQALLRTLPAGLRESSLGARILAGDTVARTFALDAAADTVRQRYRRALEQLRDLQNQATSISIEILDARRGELQAETQGAHVPPGGSRTPQIVAVDQWEDGLLWPFNGEWWEDELGTYRQRVRSRCVR